MLSAYLYVYADKFNACVQNVRLGLKCLKRRRVSELMSASKLTRLSRSKQLLREFSNTDTDFIWFTDEKVFSGVFYSCTFEYEKPSCLYTTRNTEETCCIGTSLAYTSENSARPLWCPSHFKTRLHRVIKPPLATARAASCNGRVHPFVCLSVCLSPNCNNVIFSKNSHLELQCLLATYKKSYVGFSKKPLLDA